MPKFILLSGHRTVTVAVDLVFQHLKLKTGIKAINWSAMYLFNFYECLSCEADDRFFIEFNLYPHETYDDESSLNVFKMSTKDFIKTIEDAFEAYIKDFDLKSSDLLEICKQDYVQVQPFVDPEVFRENYYKTWNYMQDEEEKEMMFD